MIDMEKVQADININDDNELRVIKEEIAICCSKINQCESLEQNASVAENLKRYYGQLALLNEKKELLEQNKGNQFCK